MRVIHKELELNLNKYISCDIQTEVLDNNGRGKRPGDT